MVVVTVNPEGQLPDQLSRAIQGPYIVIEVQFVFEGVPLTPGIGATAGCIQLLTQTGRGAAV